VTSRIIRRMLLTCVALSFLSKSIFGQSPNVVRLSTSQARITAEGAELAVPEFGPEDVTTVDRDGQWVTSVRISSSGALGLQFLIEDLRLPAGAKLSLYETDGNGQAAALRGVYELSGPLGTGQFWTAAVAGENALLEVVYENDGVSSLPFRVTTARHLNQAGVDALAQSQSSPTGLVNPDLEGTSGQAMFRGRAVPYEVHNGFAVLEGDMVLGTVDEIQPVTESGKKSARNESVGLTSTAYRWPGGVIPYTIDPTLPNQTRVTDAVAHWNAMLAGVISLVPRTNQSYYLQFTNNGPSGGCSSYVGMNYMAAQPTWLGDSCTTGNAIHEIGHVVGVFHEHTREDRNSYVQIVTANIMSGYEGNFTQNITISDDLGPYDYGSIMHYPETAFSSNGNPTIVTIPPGIPIGQRVALSSGDINGVKTMYAAIAPPPPPPPPSGVTVTLASNPTGRTLVVDGANVTAPASYTWTVGSVHTVSAPSAIVGNTNYTFSSWSDGGVQTHSITTPSSAVNLAAAYSTKHKVTVTSSDATMGTTGISPSTVDSYYAQGSTVSISAATTGSACLSSWTGISAPPSSPVQVAVTQPYSIVGNFQVGSVSASPLALSFGWKGGNGSISVSASAGCRWTASSGASWISMRTGAGTSSGTATFSVSQNQGSAARTGYIQVGTTTITITQSRK